MIFRFSNMFFAVMCNRFSVLSCSPACLLLAILLLGNNAQADSLSSALSLKMKYLSQNQSVISKNIANANTPKYKALELKELGRAGGLALKTTSPLHISNVNGANGKFRTIRQKDTYETAPNGNNVSIEEQMVKMSQNSLEHQETTNLLKKVNGLMRIAISGN